MKTRNTPNARALAKVRAFLEALGRGATPVDGVHFVEPTPAAGSPSRARKGGAGPRSCDQPLGQCAPATQGT